MNKDIKKKYFDRTEALVALYELHKQGYQRAILKILDDGTLYLGCSEKKDFFVEAPDIEIDSVDDWTQHTKERRTGGFIYHPYWWIFD